MGNCCGINKDDYEKYSPDIEQRISNTPDDRVKALYKIRNETPSPRHSPVPDTLGVNTYNGEHKLSIADLTLKLVTPTSQRKIGEEARVLLGGQNLSNQAKTYT